MEPTVKPDKFVFGTFKNIVNIHIHNNEYTNLYTKNQQLIIDINIRLIQLLVGGTTSSEWYVLQTGSYNFDKSMCINDTINLCGELVSNTSGGIICCT